MKAQPAKFVADGFDRLRRTPAHRKLRNDIADKIRLGHAASLANASGFWERFKVKWQIRGEIKDALKKLDSPECLWLSSSAPAK